MKPAGGHGPGSTQVHAHLDDVCAQVPGGCDGRFQIVLNADAEPAPIHGKIVLQIQSGLPGRRAHLLQESRIQMFQDPVIQVNPLQVQIHQQVKELKGRELPGPGAGETRPGLADAVQIQAVGVEAELHFLLNGLVSRVVNRIADSIPTALPCRSQRWFNLQ